MEWIDYTASLCSGCGNPTHETMHPDNEAAYEAVPLQCFACAARDGEARRASESRSNEHRNSSAFDGLYFAVQRRDDT